MENVLVDRAPVRLHRPARLLRLVSDERLVALVRGGDEGAFEALYDRHHHAILGFCRHMLGSREEAEDAVQHTFLAAFRDLAGSEKPIDLRPWLFAIARNRCLSLLRARRIHVAIELAEPAIDGLAATVERREDLRELLADLACLPEDQRAALLLAELGALDHAGIAAVLECPREKVKALVFQARTSLAASREARATPCEEIRVELATASGAALRRGPLRRHLLTCDGCRTFKTEVATQRKLLALALPVVPSLALKASVLGGGASGASASGGGTAAAATATVTGAPASGTLGGGALGTLASTGAGKIAVSLAVAGAVAGGGAFTAKLEQRGPAHAAPAPSGALGAPARRGAPHPLYAPRSTAMPPVQTDPVRPTGASIDAPGIVGPSHDSPPAVADGWSDIVPSPATPAPSVGEAPRHDGAAAPAHGTTPPPRRQPNGSPPGEGATPPGQAKTPPGQGTTPPGQAKTPPGQSKTPPGQGTTPPGQAKTPPGQSSTPPGQAKTPPGQGTTPPGQSSTPPGQSKTPPGQAATPPGHANTPPGQSTAPASSGPPSGGGAPSQIAAGANSGGTGPPANAGTPPGQSGGGSPGQSGASHGRAG